MTHPPSRREIARVWWAVKHRSGAPSRMIFPSGLRTTFWVPPVQIICRTVRIEIGPSTRSDQPTPEPDSRSSARTETSTVGAAPPIFGTSVRAGHGVEHRDQNVVALLRRGPRVFAGVVCGAFLLGHERGRGGRGHERVHHGLHPARGLAEHLESSGHDPVVLPTPVEPPDPHRPVLRRVETVGVEDRLPHRHHPPSTRPPTPARQNLDRYRWRHRRARSRPSSGRRPTRGRGVG